MSLNQLARHAGQPLRCSCEPAFGARSILRHARLRCRARASSDSSLPVVNDATVLPPPPTGSQYAWRSSWRGSPSSGNGGKGGTGGRSQARTRDWGSGPGSSLLFVIMYRIRLLLLYGVWVTVLYGALHAVFGLVMQLGSGVTSVAGKAAGWASSHLGSSSSSSDAAAGGDSSAAVMAAAGSDATASAAAGDAAQPAMATEAAATADQGESTTSSSNRFAEAAARMHARPTARILNDLMACVIPVYLMMMGSIVFFASM